MKAVDVGQERFQLARCGVRTIVKGLKSDSGSVLKCLPKSYRYTPAVS